MSLFFRHNIGLYAIKSIGHASFLEDISTVVPRIFFQVMLHCCPFHATRSKTPVCSQAGNGVIRAVFLTVTIRYRKMHPDSKDENVKNEHFRIVRFA